MEKIKIKNIDKIENQRNLNIAFILGMILAVCFYAFSGLIASASELILPVTITDNSNIQVSPITYNGVTYEDFYYYRVINGGGYEDTIIIYYVNFNYSTDIPHFAENYPSSSSVYFHYDNLLFCSAHPNANNVLSSCTPYSGDNSSASVNLDFSDEFTLASFNIYNYEQTEIIYNSPLDSGDLSLPFSWLSPFGSSYDDISVFYIRSPYYTYVSNLPRFGFDEFVSPEINLGFATSECFGTLPLEGEESIGCEPFSYTIKLISNGTEIDTLDVASGQTSMSSSGHLRWNYPTASSQQPFNIDIFLSSTPESDTTYTIEIYNSDEEALAEMDFIVGETLDVVTYDQDSTVAYICNDLDGSILPLDDVCRLIIPEPNYLANQFSKTYSNFLGKFYFFSQISEIINSGVTLFSDTPTQPDNISFYFRGNSYVFLNFSYISDYADDLRNYSGLTMWCSTIIALLVIVNSLFTPSQEDDLI